MKTQPNPKTRRASYAPAALPRAEQPAKRIAPPMPPAAAALLEKLAAFRMAQSLLDAASTAADCTDAALTLATNRRTTAFADRSAARLALNKAHAELAAQIATMPLTPIKHDGETFIHIPGAGLQSFKGEPLALGVQS